MVYAAWCNSLFFIAKCVFSGPVQRCICFVPILRVEGEPFLPLVSATADLFLDLFQGSYGSLKTWKLMVNTKRPYMLHLCLCMNDDQAWREVFICNNRHLSRYKLFFCFHSNLPGKPLSRALKSKEYVIHYVAERANLNADKRIFSPWKRSFEREKGVLSSLLFNVRFTWQA